MDCTPSGSSLHEISQQEYWSGLPFPSPGNLPYSGVKAVSPALEAGSLQLSHRESSRHKVIVLLRLHFALTFFFGGGGGEESILKA